jgi:Flp pilus assembly protein TadG
LVEFALVVPLLLILVLGIVEFGRAWNAYQVITDAAREAARTAVVDNANVTADSVTAVVQEAMGRAALDTTSASTTINLTGFRGGRGNPTTVYVSYLYEFAFLRPLIGWTGAQAQVTLKTSFTMRNE